MSLWRVALNDRFSNQSGVINTQQLFELGVSPKTKERLVARGEIIRVLPGVYRSGAWPMGRDQLKVAACLRNPLATLAFTTAGQEWGLRRMTDPRVHILVPHGVSPELDGIVVHRCRRIDPVDVVDRGNGLRVTSVARTLFDVGGIVGVGRLRSAVENALDKEIVNFEDISEAVQRLYHRRRPGSLQIRSVMNSRSDWSAAVQSDLELKVLVAMERAGIPKPDLQFEVRLADGSIIRFDFAWPEIQVALEVDHSFWHSGSGESTKDKNRDRKAAALGWLTVRMTDDDVRFDMNAAMTEISTIIDRRRRSLGK